MHSLTECYILSSPSNYWPSNTKETLYYWILFVKMDSLHGAYPVESPYRFYRCTKDLLPGFAYELFRPRLASYLTTKGWKRI